MQLPGVPDRNPAKTGLNQPQIAFFGNFGKGNLGNDGTLQAVLCNFRRMAPETSFQCICTGPEAVAGAYDVAALPSRDYVVKPWTISNPLARLARKLFVGIPSELYRWVQSIKTLRGTAALIIPGTGLLTDATTLLNWGPYDMLRWSLAAKLCRCKLLFVSVGAGPLNSRLGRFLVRTALALADFRSYRDESTLRYLKQIGLRARNQCVFPDLAFSLPQTFLSRLAPCNKRRRVVGLGLMLIEDARIYGVTPAGFTHAAYLEVLAEFATWLLDQEYDIRLLIGSAEDEPVKQEFKSLLQARSLKYGEERIIDEPVTCVQELLAQLAVTEMVVATRFHNVLLSLLVNKPVVAISFHHKCSSLMSQMGLSEYCQDLDGLSTAKLIERFCRLRRNADVTKQIIREKLEARRNELDEQYRMIAKVIFPAGQPAFGHAVETKQNYSSNVLS